uniref:Uncharacterized protein n=1 Tax=Anopheles culicifacies TaxID=139723 RepID=A0A182M0J3_9DIPT
MAASSSNHSCTNRQVQCFRQPFPSRTRRRSADSDGLDTLALERFRASLQERARGSAVAGSHDATSPLTIDVPTIDASASTTVQRTINQPSLAGHHQPTCTLNQESTSSGSSTGTLSTLSPWTSGSEGSAQAAIPLGRSISVPSGDRLSERSSFLDDFRTTLLAPITGDVLRQRYMMQNTERDSAQPGLQSGEASGQGEVMRRSIPGRQNLATMASVVEEVLYTKSTGLQGRPPTGKRHCTGLGEEVVVKTSSNPPTEPGAPSGDVGDLENPPTSTELANTVEPPFRGRRTLKYYSRRYRSSISYDS